MCVCVCVCVRACGLFLQYSLKWIFLLNWILIELVVLPSCTCPRSVYGVITKAARSFADPELLSIMKLFYYLFIKFKTVRRASLRNLQCISIILQILDMACPPMCRCKIKVPVLHSIKELFVSHLCKVSLSLQTHRPITKSSLTVWLGAQMGFLNWGGGGGGGGVVLVQKWNKKSLEISEDDTKAIF